MRNNNQETMRQGAAALRSNTVTLLALCVLLLYPGVTFAAPPDDTTPVRGADNRAHLARPRLLLFVSVPSEAHLDYAELETNLAPIFAKYQIELVDTLYGHRHTLGAPTGQADEGIRPVTTRKKSASHPSPNLSLTVVALNTPHLPPGLYHYGITVREIREVDKAQQNTRVAVAATDPISYESQGMANNETLRIALPARIQTLLAKYMTARNQRPTNQNSE